MAVFLCINSTIADTETNNVTVNALVQTPGQGGPGDTTDPLITNVVADPGVTTSTITWTATDPSVPIICSFAYGEDTTYGSYGTVTGNYETDLNNLIPDTEYHFRITCTDGASNTSVVTSTFTTNILDDDNPPTITNISETVDITSSTVTWESYDDEYVDECSFIYDDDDALEPFDLTDQVVELGGNQYSVLLNGLLPSTTYYYRIICIDPSSNTTSSIDSFITLRDVTPPPDVITLTATPGNEQITLDWVYTDAIPDFDFYLLRRGLTDPLTVDGGDFVTIVHDINTLTHLDPGLVNLTQYYYRIFVYDTFGNHSNGVLATAIPRGPDETGFCSDTIDNDFDGGIDCADPDCATDPTCVGVPEVCNNGVDDDIDGFIDCDDGDCALDPNCEVVVTEICDDNIDNDDDEDIDCEDSDCASFAGCMVDQPEICDDNLDNDGDGAVDCADSECACPPEPPIGGGTQCSDGIDNDGDGDIDLGDIGCVDSDDDDEYNVPTPTVPPEDDLDPTDVDAFLAERTIEVPIVRDQVISLEQGPLTLTIDGDKLSDREVNEITLTIYGSMYTFVHNPSDNNYYVDIITPPRGTHASRIEIRYNQTVIDTIELDVLSLPRGMVIDALTKEPINEAEVILLVASDDDRTWRGSEYRQLNPQFTGSSGGFGFVVPNGSYRLASIKDGYLEYRSFSFLVANNIINRTIELIREPEPIVIPVGEPLIVQIEEVTKQIGEEIERSFERIEQFTEGLIEKASELVDDPEVEDVVEQVVPPVAATVVITTVAPSIWSILFPFLRYLFFQPLLLFGRRKRKEWGIVYNSTDKLPIDLAVVRLLDAGKGTVVKSRVTDKDGRYMFIAEEGEYTIDVRKQGYTFPSEILRNVKTDGSLIDLYHGEVIKVEDEGVTITPNIPIDIIGEVQTPRRIKWEKRLRASQHTISFFGILTTAVALYISPSWYITAFLVMHIILYLLFFGYVRPRKPKGWGIVYDTSSKKPLAKVTVRLFSKQFNKLVSTQLTDSRGRYAFLVGPSEYYITFEKEGYDKGKSQIIKSDEIRSVVKQNMGLEKGQKKQ